MGGGYCLISDGFVLWLHEEEESQLAVYKVLNFSGEPFVIQAIQGDKTDQESIDYFDVAWNKLNLRQNYPNSTVPLQKPSCLKKVIELSRKMSVDMSVIRTDFYIINGHPYFSEYTFYSDCGFARFYPDEWDRKLGEMIKH